MWVKLLCGVVVKLEKDCNCSNHIGPHWIYKLYQIKQENKKYLLRKDGLGFAIAEIKRLQFKEDELARNNVMEILGDNELC